MTTKKSANLIYALANSGSVALAVTCVIALALTFKTF
jgi:hypothetical protein